MTDPDTISADYTLRPSELAATLKSLVGARQPMMVWGAPGIGKSEVAQQVAAEGGRTYCDVRALLLDPVDLRGIPWRDNDNRTRWAPPDFLPPTDSTNLWLVNLEELPSGVPMVQAALFQLVRDRKCGEYTLPEGASLNRHGFAREHMDRAPRQGQPDGLPLPRQCRHRMQYGRFARASVGLHPHRPVGREQDRARSIVLSAVVSGLLQPGLDGSLQRLDGSVRHPPSVALHLSALRTCFRLQASEANIRYPLPTGYLSALRSHRAREEVGVAPRML